MHDVVIVGVPLIAILAGTLFNNQTLTRLETRLDGRLDRLKNDVKDVRGDLTSLRKEMHREFEQFYRTLGQHDARLDNLERQR